jgi:rare lipoprotein A
MQIANVFSFSLLKFIVCGFSAGRLWLLAMCLGLLLSEGCAILQRPDIAAPTPPPPPTAKKVPAVQAKLPQTGEASWYGAAHQGKPTASGEKFDQARLTAAHRSLPFGTKIKVTNLGNGKTVEVEINDRGPFAENRIIDLSHAAAKALEIIDSGTATVRLELASGP